VSDPDPRPARPRLELADVLRRHADDYIRRRDGHLDRVQRRVMSAIVACRTAVLGGHVETCTACRASRVAYNSCRNRHCPKCQGGARTRWLAARERELLPVPYFHVVFTVPAPIGAIAFQNKAVVYAILFKAAAEAMTTLAANPRRLGAEIGAVAVLHTWGQALNHHPHLHCVVPGGGLAPDDARWVQGRANFFLAVKPLARLFRRLFLERLAAAFDKGELRFFSDLAALADRERFAGHLASLRGSTGSFMPRSRSAAPPRSSPISAATPIASPSPTADSCPATSTTSRSPGRTTARAAPPRSCA